MKSERSYLRGVIAPEVHEWYLSESQRHGVDLAELQTEALEWFIEQLRKSSSSRRPMSMLRAPRTVKLVDVRAAEAVCNKVRKSAEDAGVSVRQWIYSALTLFNADHDQP